MISCKQVSPLIVLSINTPKPTRGLDALSWIDWGYLRRLASPVKEVVDAVYTHCWEMDLVDIMSFQCHWNEEVVAQFYATLYIEENERVIHWNLGGKRFTYNVADFSTLFGHTGHSVFFGGSLVVSRDDSKVDLMQVMSLSHPRCTSYMMWPMVMLCMDRSRVSLHTIDSSTLSSASLSLLEGVILTTSHIEQRIYLFIWLQGSQSLQLWNLFGMRFLDALMTPLVLVTMRHIFFI